MHLGRLDHVLQAGLQLLAEDVDAVLGRFDVVLVVVFAAQVEAQIELGVVEQLIVEGKIGIAAHKNVETSNGSSVCVGSERRMIGRSNRAQDGIELTDQLSTLWTEGSECEVALG